MKEKSRYLVIFSFAAVAGISFYAVYNETDIQTHPAADEPLSESVAFMDAYNETKFANGASHNGLTFEKYNRIGSGMSYEKVCEILGEPNSKKEAVDSETMTYSWQSNDAGVVEVTFKNAEVSQKTQTGLPETTTHFTKK